MAIIVVADLPASIQTHELVAAMVAGANAKASRVAPCLVAPSAAWAATTAYTVGQTRRLPGGEGVEVTIAGTSSAVAPAAPPALDDTVTDGTVTWKAIAPTTDQLAEAKLVLIGAVKRWAEAGAGALQSQTAGPYGMTVDTRQRTGYNLWPSEITALQDICATGGEAKAFAVDTVADSTVHADWCALAFGATYCSCGADIAGYPIFEQA